jgi:hypothetical protein
VKAPTPNYRCARPRLCFSSMMSSSRRHALSELVVVYELSDCYINEWTIFSLQWCRYKGKGTNQPYVVRITEDMKCVPANPHSSTLPLPPLDLPSPADRPRMPGPVQQIRIYGYTYDQYGPPEMCHFTVNVRVGAQCLRVCRRRKISWNV